MLDQRGIDIPAAWNLDRRGICSLENEQLDHLFVRCEIVVRTGMQFYMVRYEFGCFQFRG